MMSKKSKAPNKTKKLIIISLLTAVLAGGLVYSVIELKETSQNKKSLTDFEHATSLLEQVYEGVGRQAGQPSALDRQKSCTRANLKTEEGPLICSSSIVFTYRVSDIVSAQSLVSDIDKVLQSQPLLRTAGEAPDLISATKRIPAESTRNPETKRALEMNSDMTCGAYFKYVAVGSTNKSSLIDKNSSNLYVSLGCNAEARDEYYHID